MKNLKGLCKRCEKGEVCKKLCETAIEYANQDYIAMSNSQINNLNMENIPIESCFTYDFFDDFQDLRYQKARWRTAVINLYRDGLSYRHIAYHVPYSKSRIAEIIQEYKKGVRF